MKKNTHTLQCETNGINAQLAESKIKIFSKIVFYTRMFILQGNV